MVKKPVICAIVLNIITFRMIKSIQERVSEITSKKQTNFKTIRNFNHFFISILRKKKFISMIN